MGGYRRSRLICDAFRNLSTKTIPKIPIQKPPNPISNQARGSGFSSSSSISTRFGLNFESKHNQYCRFLSTQKRNYNVDPNRVQHIRPRGNRKWFQKARKVLIVVLVGSGVLITVYFGNLETIPYTNRTHLMLLSKNAERRNGEAQFEEMKKAFKGKILPAIHPESIRVRLIASDIIEALQRGLRHEDKVWSDLGYASEEPRDGDGGGYETLLALREGSEVIVYRMWRKEDDILDDHWVKQSRKKGQARGAQPATQHLEGLNWEILVVQEPVVNAFCLPGGKIVVFTG